MRRVFQTFLAVLLLGVALPCAEAQSQERIRDFHSEIKLLDDGTLLVKETITVVGAGNQIRHGIFRDFPTRYKDRSGNNYVVGFRWIGATRDGQAEISRVESVSNGERIYLGDSRSYLRPGEHVYELVYSTNRQLGFFKDHDELYWNVTGNGWGFPIDHATAIVTLPAAISGSGVSLDGFTGPQGSLEKSLTHQATASGEFRFDALTPLRPREGLSIVLSWQKGLIAEPTRQQKLDLFFTDNRDALIAAAALLVLLVYYTLAWSAIGRDPARGVIMALYEPPGNLSPAAMRCLVRMGFDNKTLAAAILDMATRGYLRIAEQAGSYTLYRTKAGDGILTADEKEIAGAMFSDRSELWMNNVNHAIISKGMLALKTNLKVAQENIYFFTNGWYLLPGIVFSVTVVALVSYLRSPATLAAVAFMALWLSIWSLAVAGLLAGIYASWKSVVTSTAHQGMLAGKALLVTLFALPFIAGECFGILVLIKFGSLFVALFLFASIVLHLLFHYLLKAPTIAGRKLLDQVEGFRLYLSKVDGDRLNRINPPELTPATFEKFLPYALALDVEQAWAEKFSGVLIAAGQAPGEPASGYSPAFYSGSGWSGASAAGFTSGFSSSFIGAISSSSSAPGSSSGGSGGGSGGGGGGGGGGGW